MNATMAVHNMDCVETWAKMWNLKKQKFLPAKYQRDLFSKFQDLKQYNKSIVDHMEEFF